MEGVGNNFFANFNVAQAMENPAQTMQMANMLITPELVRTAMVNPALEAINANSDAEVNQIVAKIKSSEGGSPAEVFQQVLGVVPHFNNAEFNPLFQKLNSAPMKKEIFKLADNPKMQKILNVMGPIIQENAKEFCSQITNPEAKKCAETYLKKFKILPSDGFFAKIWNCIKDIFQKLFCCCKKKEKAVEVEGPREVRTDVAEGDDIIMERTVEASAL